MCVCGANAVRVHPKQQDTGHLPVEPMHTPNPNPNPNPYHLPVEPVHAPHCELHRGEEVRPRRLQHAQHGVLAEAAGRVDGQRGRLEHGDQVLRLVQHLDLRVEHLWLMAVEVDPIALLPPHDVALRDGLPIQANAPGLEHGG